MVLIPHINWGTKAYPRVVLELAFAGALAFGIAACGQAQGGGGLRSAEGAALADIERRAGQTCVQAEDILRVLPSDIDAQVRAVGGIGWTSDGSIWMGDDLAAAAAKLGGTLFVASPGEAWISGVVGGQPTALRLVERKTPGGATVWLVVGRVTPTDCPADED
jgi:hypothetical protein